MEIAIGAVGLLVGVVVGWGAGRRVERASYAWGMTRAWYGVTRMLASEAAGFLLGAAVLVGLAVAALLVTRG